VHPIHGFYRFSCRANSGTRSARDLTFFGYQKYLGRRSMISTLRRETGKDPAAVSPNRGLAMRTRNACIIDRGMALQSCSQRRRSCTAGSSRPLRCAVGAKAAKPGCLTSDSIVLMSNQLRQPEIERFVVPVAVNAYGPSTRHDNDPDISARPICWLCD